MIGQKLQLSMTIWSLQAIRRVCKPLIRHKAHLMRNKFVSRKNGNRKVRIWSTSCHLIEEHMQSSTRSRNSERCLHLWSAQLLRYSTEGRAIGRMNALSSLTRSSLKKLKDANSALIGLRKVGHWQQVLKHRSLQLKSSLLGRICTVARCIKAQLFTGKRHQRLHIYRRSKSRTDNQWEDDHRQARIVCHLESLVGIQEQLLVIKIAVGVGRRNVMMLCMQRLISLRGNRWEMSVNASRLSKNSRVYSLST